MQIEYKDRYPHQPPSLPEYDVSPISQKINTYDDWWNAD